MPTATKRRKPRKFTQDQLRAWTAKPIKNRRELAIGRDGQLVKPRNHFIHDTADIERYKELFAAGDPVPNPHNKGAYYFTLEALKKVALNRNASFAVVFAKFKELMSAETHPTLKKTYWAIFRDKPSRNDDTGLDAEGRFRQNVSVLRRQGGANPYGAKLIDIGRLVLGTKGVVIDIRKGSDGREMYFLNTDSDTPINEFRQSKSESKEADDVESAAA